MQLDYTVSTTKNYASAVEAVTAAAEKHGFRVQFVHDVSGTLAEKGFEREPVTIVEMCNAGFAHKVLEKDLAIGLMLPCPVMVYEQSGKVSIATGWQHGPTVDKGDRWDAAELGPIVDDLLTKAPSPAPVYGTT